MVVVVVMMMDLSGGVVSSYEGCREMYVSVGWWVSLEEARAHRREIVRFVGSVGVSVWMPASVTDVSLPFT